MKKERGILLLRTIAAFLLAALLAAGGVLQRNDRGVYDTFALIKLALMQSRPNRNLPLIVAIDAQSLRQHGRWPWPRSLLGRLIRLLRAGEPSAIGLDLLLVEPDAGDADLASALRTAPVILAERLDLRKAGSGPPNAGRIEQPPAALTAATGERTGFIDFFPDSDGVTRSMVTQARTGGVRHISLAAALAQRSGAMSALPPGEIPLVFGLKPDQWEIVSAGEILAGRISPTLWRDRPILVGLTAPGVSGDFYPVAVRAMGRVPGVLLHAYAYATMTEWGAMRNPPPAILILMALMACGLPALPARWRRPWPVVGITIAIIFLIFLASLALFLRGTWYAPSWPVAAAGLAASAHLIGGAAEDRRRILRLRATFAKFVSSAVLQQVLNGPEPSLRGEAREITVLFADLRGFTAFTEQHSPAEVALELNRHLALMSRAILKHGGMLDKFMGDAVMGVFGAPLAGEDHRARALAAAAEIRDVLNVPGFLPAGIGVAAGLAVVGNIGSHERLEYTAIGDPVNLAARLEELAGPHEILAAKACFTGRPGPEWEPLGEMHLRGRAEPVAVYRSMSAITETAAGSCQA